jgi:hypothetical protein
MKNVRVGSQTIEWDIEHLKLDSQMFDSTAECSLVTLDPNVQ